MHGKRWLILVKVSSAIARQRNGSSRLRYVICCVAVGISSECTCLGLYAHFPVGRYCQMGILIIIIMVCVMQEGQTEPFSPLSGFVKIAFVHALIHLRRNSSYHTAISETLQGGGDTGTEMKSNFNYLYLFSDIVRRYKCVYRGRAHWCRCWRA